MDLFFRTIMNESRTMQRSNDKNGTRFEARTISDYFAAHVMNTQSYYGIQTTSDMYSVPVDKDEQSGMFIQLYNQGNGRSNHNAISVGWHVYPALYGDSKTHFYVYWTRDGYQKTGCYNLNCPGYVHEANVNIVPGVTIDVVSDPNGVKRTIIVKVFKDGVGDWLLHIGFDSEPYLIGRFPKSLFTGLGDKADTIRLGGFVQTHVPHLAPMGSGFLPNNIKAASFSNIQLIDQNGQASKVRRDHPVFIDDGNIYSVSPINAEGMFSYGGPLG